MPQHFSAELLLYFVVCVLLFFQQLEGLTVYSKAPKSIDYRVKNTIHPEDAVFP